MSRVSGWILLSCAVGLSACATDGPERPIISGPGGDYRLEVEGPHRPTYPVPVPHQPYAPDSLPRYVTPERYDALARQHFAEGRTDEAQRALEEALQVNPFDPAALNNLAVVRSEQGAYYEAIELLQRASRLAPDDPEIAGNLARLRNWVQVYGMTSEAPSGVLPDPNDGTPSLTRGPTVPPPAPPLWDPRPSRF